MNDVIEEEQGSRRERHSHNNPDENQRMEAMLQTEMRRQNRSTNQIEDGNDIINSPKLRDTNFQS